MDRDKQKRNKNVINQSLNADRGHSKSRLIIRGESSESIRSMKRIPKTRQNKEPKHYSKLVISIRKDLDPNNVFEKIESFDMEIDQLERKMPTDLTEDEESEVIEMMNANKELRQKVNEVSQMVKMTLIKVSSLRAKSYHKQSREHKEDPEELRFKKEQLQKVHTQIQSKKLKIEHMRKQVNAYRIDPRTEELHDKLRTIDNEITIQNDELRVLKMQTKTQLSTIGKLNNNPRFDERLDLVKADLASTKEQVKKQEAELKDISQMGQTKTADLIKLEEEVRKVREKIALVKNGKLTKELQAEKEKNKLEQEEIGKQELLAKRCEVEDQIHKKGNLNLFDFTIKTLKL